MNICFKIDEILFCKYLELSSKMMFDLNLRILPSQYGEVSVMRDIAFAMSKISKKGQ